MLCSWEVNVMSGIVLPSITDSVVYQPTRLWPAEKLAPTYAPQ